MLLFVVVGVLAAAGGALLYRYVTGKRRRTAVPPRDEAAVPFDETVAVTSSLGGPSFPDEAAVMDGSPGSTYFPLPLTERYQDVRFVGKGGVLHVSSVQKDVRMGGRRWQ